MASPRIILMSIFTAISSILVWRYIYVLPGPMSMMEHIFIWTFACILLIYTTAQTFCPYIWQDLAGIPLMMKVKKKLKEHGREKLLAATLLERRAAEHPNKVFLIYKNEKFTYKEVHDKANQMANMVKMWNIPKGQVVSMMMINEPAFLWAFFGLAKLGIPMSLINTNVRKDGLAHCINVTNSKDVIVSSKLRSAIDDVGKDKIPGVTVHDVESINNYPDDMVGPEARTHVKLRDVFGYVFTSGTTGLPKAVRVINIRVHEVFCIALILKLTSDDIVYVSVPLFHGSGMYGLLPTLAAGGTVVVKEKFSATDFWKDCMRHGVTAMTYIGELCRYLVNQPPDPDDGTHCIRMAMGNGLRPDVWPVFCKRFRIPWVYELYGASEGQSVSMNLTNTVGSIGRYTPFKRRLDPIPKHLVKCDMETAMPIRDKNGRCIAAKQEEPGLFITGLHPLTNPKQIYEGDEELSKRTILRNVFKEGDSYFNTGDLIYRDADYNLYFADRLGDTFRWKGENVSTLEVANVLTTLSFIADANVYGVEVKGADGRAGMACLKLTDNQVRLSTTQREEMYKICSDALPTYARPTFLRVPKTFLLTETFKHKKMAFKEEGYDIHKISDPLYFIYNSKTTYVPITEEVYKEIESGNVRF